MKINVVKDVPDGESCNGCGYATFETGYYGKRGSRCRTFNKYLINGKKCKQCLKQGAKP